MKTYSLKQLNKSFIKAGLFTIIMAILGGGVMFGYAKLGRKDNKHKNDCSNLKEIFH